LLELHIVEFTQSEAMRSSDERKMGR
jgi:hypothetical protein